MFKIAVITGTRAEYGLLKPLLFRLKQHDAFELQLIVTGTHLSNNHGYTVNEIINDGFKEFIRIDIQPGSTIKDAANSMAICLNSMTETFVNINPDIIVLLGDRYEIFATAQAALLTKIPIVHIHGGEITEGAFDDAIRHSITKMAHIHFTTSDLYSQRVIQMGENPKMVFNTGSLGHENMLNTPLMSKKELEIELNYTFSDQNILVTHHPVTSIPEYEYEIDKLLEALDQLNSDTGIIITAANADPGGTDINSKKEEFAKNHHNCIYVPNLGISRYVSVMKYIDGVVGNSSSGLIEAPSLGKWTLNIGPRQNGRIKADSVVDCEANDDLITNLNSLIQKQHPASTVGPSSLFGDGKASLKMIEILNRLRTIKIKTKSFYDYN